LDPQTRRRFDEQLERVLAEMPPLVHQLLERIPLHVEDYPSSRVMRQLGLRFRDEICGLFSGIPLGDKSVEHVRPLPDVVTIYREGILAAAADKGHGHITPKRLREQIRITILHELAHFHGLTEQELRELGYQ